MDYARILRPRTTSPPFGKGGQGGFRDLCTQTFFTALPDRFEDRRSFLQHLQVIEPQHSQPLSAEISIATMVLINMTGLEVLPTINLDNQTHSRSIEVDDVRTNRALTVKLHSKNLLASNPAPKPLLGIRHRDAEVSTQWFQILRVLPHDTAFLHDLEQPRRPHPTADAHRHHHVLHATPLALDQRVTHEPAAGRAIRMAHR